MSHCEVSSRRENHKEGSTVSGKSPDAHVVVRKFAPGERKQILDNLVRELDADPAVAGVMFAGSTSEGFRDDYSDIDLIVIAQPEDFSTVVKRWVGHIESNLPVIRRFHGLEHERKIIYCFLLEGFLELDVLFESLTTLSSRSRRKIVFDRTGRMSEILQSSPPELEPVPLFAYAKACMDSIWYHVTHTITALHRGHNWKALYEVDQIRSRAFSLFGLLKGLDVEDYAEVDHLPAETLADLEKTLVHDTSKGAIFAALELALGCFFEAAREVAAENGSEAPDGMEALLKKYLEEVKAGVLD